MLKCLILFFLAQFIQENVHTTYLYLHKIQPIVKNLNLFKVFQLRIGIRWNDEDDDTKVSQNFIKIIAVQVHVEAVNNSINKILHQYHINSNKQNSVNKNRSTIKIKYFKLETSNTWLFLSTLLVTLKNIRVA